MPDKMPEKMMRKQIGALSCFVTLGIVLLSARQLPAQDVAITNARIVVGNGTVINSGTVVVRGGNGVCEVRTNQFRPTNFRIQKHQRRNADSAGTD